MISLHEEHYIINNPIYQTPSKKQDAAVHDEIIELMRSGVLKGEEYISDVFDLDDAVEAIEFFQAHKNAKKIAIRM